LYGYIIAGDTHTSIAYIVPAYQAFADIENTMGAPITFPVLEQVFNHPGVWFDSDFLPHWAPKNTSNLGDEPLPVDHASKEYKDYYHVSDSGNLSSFDALSRWNKTSSSRPTTLSDDSLGGREVDGALSPEMANFVSSLVYNQSTDDHHHLLSSIKTPLGPRHHSPRFLSSQSCWACYIAQRRVCFQLILTVNIY
jgi:hypothetical protein